MAIIKKLMLESGLVIEHAYIRVQGVNGNKNLASVSLEIFASQSLCELGKAPATHRSYTFTPLEDETSPRWDKQAYEYIKTLPEYENAVDA